MLKKTQMKLMMTLIVGLLFYTVPAFSELTSETDNLPSSAAEMGKGHADLLFVLGMGLIVIITILYIAAQIVGEMNRRKLETQNQKIESLNEQIESMMQEIEILKQERTVSP